MARQRVRRARRRLVQGPAAYPQPACGRARARRAASRCADQRSGSLAVRASCRPAAPAAAPWTADRGRRASSRRRPRAGRAPPVRRARGRRARAHARRDGRARCSGSGSRRRTRTAARRPTSRCCSSPALCCSTPALLRLADVLGADFGALGPARSTWTSLVRGRRGGSTRRSRALGGVPADRRDRRRASRCSPPWTGSSTPGRSGRSAGCCSRWRSALVLGLARAARRRAAPRRAADRRRRPGDPRDRRCRRSRSAAVRAMPFGAATPTRCPTSGSWSCSAPAAA